MNNLNELFFLLFFITPLYKINIMARQLKKKKLTKLNDVSFFIYEINIKYKYIVNEYFLVREKKCDFAFFEQEFKQR